MVDVEALGRAVEGTGAVVLGRRRFDFVDGPTAWGTATHLTYRVASAARET